MHTHTHTHACTDTHTHMHSHTHTQMRMHTHTHTHMHTFRLAILDILTRWSSIHRFGTCEPYRGSGICNSVYTQGVDNVYIPSSRGVSQEMLNERLEMTFGTLLEVVTDECRELFSKYVCNSLYFHCGTNLSEIVPPVSVCPEECSFVKESCPELWMALQKSSEFGGEDFTNCNTTGDILEPLAHCCSDADIDDGNFMLF